MTLAVAVQHQRAVLPALGRYELALASSELDVYEAQRLRYRVFHDELGARLTSRIPGLDCDFFDPHCEHLIVRDRLEQRVVGCYRVLTPEGARRVGGLYSEQEYDLVRLDPLRERMVEVGRACIAPGHRHGGVIALLFAGLASYLDVRGYRYLFGLASVPLHGGIDAVHALFATQWATHAAPIEYHVTPRQPLPEVGGAALVEPAPCPALLKAYLNAGAWLCGAPALDADFQCADVPVLLSAERISRRYVRHFRAEVGRMGSGG